MKVDTNTNDMDDREVEKAREEVGLDEGKS